MANRLDNIHQRIPPGARYKDKAEYIASEEDRDNASDWLDLLEVFRDVPKLVVITPEMALAFYKHRAKNRYISKANLQRLMVDIRAGRWKVTGETIIFDNEDKLIDGQHRMLACIECNLPIRTYVVRGSIDHNATTGIDIGKGRTPGDLLSFRGHEDGNHLAATIRWIHRLKSDGMQFERIRMTRDELIDFLAKNNDVILSAPFGRFVRQLIVPSLGSALHFTMALKDRELANQYFHELQQGTGEPGSPSFVVRELLIKNKLHRAQLPLHVVAAMIIKAWNLLRSGKTTKIIRWYGDKQNERYPEVK